MWCGGFNVKWRTFQTVITVFRNVSGQCHPQIVFNVHRSIKRKRLLRDFLLIRSRICWTHAMRRYSSAVAEDDTDELEVSQLDAKELKSKSRLSRANYRYCAVPHETIITTIIQCDSVNEQIQKMVELVKVSDAEIEKCLELCKRLEDLIKPYITGHFVLIGSSLTGFGMKGCDVDLTFQTSWDLSMREYHYGVKDLPNVEDIDDGTVPISKLQCFSPLFQLRFIRRVLRKYAASECHEPIELLKGRCPIIRFAYGPERLHCDISYDNRISINTTRLLRVCGLLDERVIQLTKVILYWAKENSLVGNFKFKSYAFVLLAFHFLQKTTPPVLPPLKDILNLVSDIDSFDDQVSDVRLFRDKIPQSTNKQTVEELLREFFFYYLQFDYDQAICPFSGELVSKSAIMWDSEIEEAEKFQVTSICIQDPVNLTWNVTTGVNYKYGMQFLNSVRTACKLYEDGAMGRPKETFWGVAALLTQNDLFSRIQSFDLDIPDIVTDSNRYKSARDEMLISCQNVVKILRTGLMFSCSVLSGHQLETSRTSASGSLSAEDSSDETDSVTNRAESGAVQREELIYEVRGTTRNTWQNRCKWKPEHFPPMEPLSLERLISHRSVMTAQVYSYVGKFFECKHYDRYILRLQFSSTGRNGFNPKLVIFLKNYLPTMLKKIKE